MEMTVINNRSADIVIEHGRVGRYQSLNEQSRVEQQRTEGEVVPVMIRAKTSGGVEEGQMSKRMSR